MAVAELALAIEVLVVLAVATLLTAILRTPRLRLEASLRGGTADGTLYAVVTHRKGWAAKGVRVEVAWRKGRARSASVQRDLGTTRAGDAVRLEIDELQRLLPAHDRSGWESIDVRLHAWNALPRRVSVPLVPRGAASAGAPGGQGGAPEPAPVQYARARDLPCPERADGRHDYEERPYMNDGVMERWLFCRACRHVVRHPLTPEQEAVQRRTRAARAERLRRLMEEEFARLDEEQQARERERRRRRPPPPTEDAFPVEVAFFVLELDPATARWEDVAAAHRRLALAHHPDRHAGASPDARAAAERKMQEINAARDRLREHFDPAA